MVDPTYAKNQMRSAKVILDFLAKHPDTRLRDNLLVQATYMVDTAADKYGMSVPWAFSYAQTL